MSTIDIQHISKFSNFELLAKQVVEGFITGMHRSPFHGFSVEFAEHRLYNAGESTRHIDWKLYARTDKLFVKRYEEETNLRCHIVIDDSSSMYFPIKGDLPYEVNNKITFSAFAGATLMELMKRQRDAFGLTLFSEQMDVHTPAKSSVTHQKLLFNYLEKVMQFDGKKQLKKSNTAEMLHLLAERIHRRSLVIIFSDMFQNTTNETQKEALFSALQHLKYNKHEIILFHVADKKLELDFEFDNRPYQFIDLESGEMLKLQPSEVKQYYQEAIQKYTQELKLKCTSYGIDFVEADINAGYEQILWNFLVKRAKMY